MSEDNLSTEMAVLIYGGIFLGGVLALMGKLDVRSVFQAFMVLMIIIGFMQGVKQAKKKIGKKTNSL